MYEDEFQFQTGSIKRLRNAPRDVQERMFQFQTGSIKSGSDVYYNYTKTKFQFQTGSIKSLPDTLILPSVPSRFNSKLVRLKVNAYDAKIPIHEVSIPNWFD